MDAPQLVERTPDQAYAATQARGAHFLGRLPATVKPIVVRTLAGDTQLVRVRPSDYRRRRGDHVVVRLIRYTLDDPHRPGCGVEHRLVTSLLNPSVPRPSIPGSIGNQSPTWPRLRYHAVAAGGSPSLDRVMAAIPAASHERLAYELDGARGSKPAVAAIVVLTSARLKTRSRWSRNRT